MGLHFEREVIEIPNTHLPKMLLIPLINGSCRYPYVGRHKLAG